MGVDEIKEMLLKVLAGQVGIVTRLERIEDWCERHAHAHRSASLAFKETPPPEVRGDGKKE